jgi:hypothetical protein
MKGPEYVLALAVIRRTLLDALNGYGLETLAALFYPAQQAAIAVLLDVDTNIAMQRTLTACQTLLTLDDDKRDQVRHALAWMSPGQLERTLEQALGVEAQ